jgi:hypothetical protein
MPLVIEGNKRGIQSTFYVGASHKYNCPFKYAKLVTQLAEKNNIELKPLEQVSEATGVLFSSEKTGIDRVSNAVNAKKVVCTYQTDFIESYKSYEKVCDHILMPSKKIADYYDRHTDKNLYLGIPKYEVSLDRNKILDKYSLAKDKKYLTYISPKARDQEKIKAERLLKSLENTGYSVLFKTRGKDPLDPTWAKKVKEGGHRCFTDDSWYPHTTQELLAISDAAINFGSTTVEECVMQDVPLMNFDIKPKVRNGSKRPYRVTHDYLYNYNYCIQMSPDYADPQIAAAIAYLTKTDLSQEFKKARAEYLFDYKNTCKRIMDVLV